ncbi:hypothetical protein [Yunchengibacter salinarum]|uniref:hypothetical protein n=1 Tax=Yunchengibacter salinarum TaxID=3133399 RepID=UPI0035B63618
MSSRANPNHSAANPDGAFHHDPAAARGPARLSASHAGQEALDMLAMSGVGPRLVGMMRLFARIANTPAGSDERRAALESWGRESCLLGSLAAARSLDGFLATWVRNARCMVRCGCACCGRISADEGRFLAVVSLMQHGETAAARRLLAVMVHPGAVSMVQDAALHLADGLNRGGLGLAPATAPALRSLWVMTLAEQGRVPHGAPHLPNSPVAQA